jgi:hypothetical protein
MAISESQPPEQRAPCTAYPTQAQEVEDKTYMDWGPVHAVVSLTVLLGLLYQPKGLFKS